MEKKHRRNPKRPETTSNQSKITTTNPPEKPLPVEAIKTAPMFKWGEWNIYNVLMLIATIIGVAVAIILGLPEPQRNNYLYAVGLVGASATPTVTPTSTPSPTGTLTPTNTPTITPTPLGGTPFAEDEVGVVLADFADLDAGAREVERRIERQFEEAGIPFIRVHHTIADREQAQSIAALYNATITMWGESADAWIEVFYEITPRNEREVDTTIENIAVAADLENFSTYIREGMDTLYLVYFTMGQIHYFADENETALAFFNQAIERIPEGREADVKAGDLYVYRGISYADLGRYEQAIADFTLAIELNENVANAYYNRGVTNADLGRYEQAIADYTSAIEVNANYAIAYYNRGVIYESLGNYEQAVLDYTSTIEHSSEFVRPYNGRCWVRTTRLNNHVAALEDCNRAIELSPNHYPSYDSRCWVKKILAIMKGR